ncbi:MAG TPA: hypothetical protein PKD72_14465 [Gemmatales bacterium]|nr:hypothetical protein [Gemmatales bacterium]
MNRPVVCLALAAMLLSLSGCAACRSLFGLDRRCEQQPPPNYYNAPPMYQQAPMNYGSAPCNAPQ